MKILQHSKSLCHTVERWRKRLNSEMKKVLIAMYCSLHESASKVKAMSHVGTGMLQNNLQNSFKNIYKTVLPFILFRDIERETFVTIFCSRIMQRYWIPRPKSVRVKSSIWTHQMIPSHSQGWAIFRHVTCQAWGQLPHIPRLLVTTVDSDSGDMRASPLGVVLNLQLLQPH